MKSIRIEAIVVALAATVLIVAAQGEKRDLGFSERLRNIVALTAQGKNCNLLTEVIPEKRITRLGDPIVVSVRVTNQAPKAVEASRSATAFDCFEITDPDGKRLRYVGFDGQVVVTRVDIPPLSTVTVAEALDLTDKYLFLKPGRYSVRFSSKCTNSPAINIEVAPGRSSEFDDVAASLLRVCPDGWQLAKGSRGEVAPFGGSRVPGFVLHLCHNHMRGEAVFLWFTKEEAQADPNQKPRGDTEDWGRAQTLFVYGSIGSNTPASWPTATEDISRALQIITP